jgi:hypothetical protein
MLDRFNFLTRVGTCITGRSIIKHCVELPYLACTGLHIVWSHWLWNANQHGKHIRLLQEQEIVFDKCFQGKQLFPDSPLW